MLTIVIPGTGELQLTDAIFDFNGTLAIEGKLIDGVAQRLNALSQHLNLHVVTGNGFANAESELVGIPCKLTILSPENQGIAKRDYLNTLNPTHTVTIGNGKNDQYMLKDAALGIVILGREGVALETLLAADVVMPDIGSALDTLLQKKRLIGTLRS